MDENIFDKTGANEDEFFYSVMMTNLFKIFSPFEVAKDVDFPKKDELGGVVLKFIGGGAAYFKIQHETPSDSEIQSIFEIGKFLHESFGDYIVLSILCMPHIEIRDIGVLSDENIRMSFISLRKSYAEDFLDVLIEKLENNEEFTADDHIYKLFIPFSSKKSNEEFEVKYSKFINLYSKSNIKEPSVNDLAESCVAYNHWFSDDLMMHISGFNQNFPKK